MLDCCREIELTVAMVAASHSSDAKTVEEEDLAQTERDHITPKRNNADALSINDV